MNIMKVTTGFGYFKDDKGNIICKYNLPIGEHPLRTEFTFTELPNEASLNSVIVYQPPETIEQERKRKLSEEIKEIAKKSLKDKGEWPE